MAPDDVVLGIDFGTTNTVLARSGGGGTDGVVRFAAPEGRAETAYRSVLCVWQALAGRALERRVESGPWALERYVADPHDCRFLQSFKSFAASRAFVDTLVYGRRMRFEDLLSTFLGSLAQHYGAALPPRRGRVVVGRPVTFAGATPDDGLAMDRYDRAFAAAGFADVAYVYEPVAAAFFFAQRLVEDATVLVADFGGGTSDFSIIRFERRGGRLSARPLGASGVAVAGDTFDSRIVDRVVGPLVGKGSDYVSFGKVLPVPAHYFANFAQWHTLSLLKSAATLRELAELARTAPDPTGLLRFVTIIEEDLGYLLYRAVSQVKTRLSTEESAEFSFRAGAIDIRAEVTRADFESWIAPDLDRIDRAVEAALAAASLGAGDIDRVFLTGGTSLVPAVQRRFADRFGAERLETGNEFDSIAAGLALIGREAEIEPWCVPRAA
jgi:hypothetical chaperone protein